MPTIGTGTFFPGGRFTFPRSYIAEVYNASAGFALTQVANRFTLDFRPTFGSVYHWTYHLAWWAWSSNVWTLDHIIEESYYVNPPDPTQIPLNYGLYWQRHTLVDKPYLLFLPNGNPAVPVLAQFPPTQPDYWTRPT